MYTVYVDRFPPSSIVADNTYIDRVSLSSTVEAITLAASVAQGVL